MSTRRHQYAAALDHAVIVLHWIARAAPTGVAPQLRRIADSLSARASKIRSADEQGEATDDPLDPGPSPTSFPPNRSAQTRGPSRISLVRDDEDDET